MNSEKLQNNLIKLRQEKGITQKELADIINYSDKVISKWERGESLPNIEAISVLAEYFDVTIDFFVGKDALVSQKMQNTIELDVIKTESPSFLEYLFIVPFAVFWGVTMISSPDYIGVGFIIIGIGMVLYSMVISKSSFESTYEGTKIKIKNRAFSCKLYIGSEMVSETKNPLRVNPIIEGYLNQKKVKVMLSNITSIKCRVFIN